MLTRTTRLTFRANAPWHHMTNVPSPTLMGPGSLDFVRGLELQQINREMPTTIPVAIRAYQGTEGPEDTPWPAESAGPFTQL